MANSIFLKQDVFLAHCVSENGGAGNPTSDGKDFYQRFNEAIDEPFEISSSTIGMGDTLIHLKQTNFFGPAGIILKNGSITYANYKDGGTRALPLGERDYDITPQTEPTLNNISNAIQKRSPTQYNEFCVKNYDVFGIFLCFDDPTYLIQNIRSELDFYKNLSHHELPFFNLAKGQLYSSIFDPSSMVFRANGKVVSPSYIYS